jgi:endonuclease I
MKKTLFVLLFAFIYAFCLSAQAPSGYYQTAQGLSDYNLKTALCKIIRGHKRLTYTPGLWEAYQYTDTRPETGRIWDIYSATNFIYGSFANGGDQCYTTGVEGFCYNREHSFPKSWWNSTGSVTDTAFTDIMHIYPADSWVNSLRNNNPYAEVGTYTKISANGSKVGASVTEGYTGTAFEPIDEYKGDLARTYFYMATRYQGTIAGWVNSSGVRAVFLNGTSNQVYADWFLQMLLRWHRNDPVSQKETDRNNAIYTLYQNNRNPYIDFPELVEYIWGNKQGEPWNISSESRKTKFFFHPQKAIKNDKIFVSVDGIQEELKYGIYTLSGSCLMKGSLQTTGCISVSQLPSGLYLLKLFGEENTLVEKIVISKK